MLRIYYRVSTDKQDFDMQKNAIENYLKIHEITTYEIYEDLGISGLTAERSEYQRLLADIREGDALLVYEFSRLWRDMEEQSRVTKIILALGLTLISVTEGTVKNEEDALISDVKGVINQHEARRFKRRSKDGIKALQDKCATGEKVWNGRGPDKVKRSNEGYLKMWENRKRRQ